MRNQVYIRSGYQLSQYGFQYHEEVVLSDEMAKKLIANLCNENYSALGLIVNSWSGEYLKPILINQFQKNIKTAIIFAMQFFE